MIHKRPAILFIALAAILLIISACSPSIGGTGGSAIGGGVCSSSVPLASGPSGGVIANGAGAGSGRGGTRGTGLWGSLGCHDRPGLVAGGRSGP